MKKVGDEIILIPTRAVRLTGFLIGGIFWIGLPFLYRKPSDIFPCLGIFAIGLFFQQFLSSIRVILDPEKLKCRQLGFTKWSVSRRNVGFKEGLHGAYGGLPALLVYNRDSGELVGAISHMQFDLEDINLIKAQIEIPTKFRGSV